MSAGEILYTVRNSRIAAPTGDFLGKTLETGDYYESSLLAELANHVDGGVVIDVGACIGNHAAFFAGEADAAKVIAIEPNPEAYRFLERTVTLSGRSSTVECVHAAVHHEWASVNVTASCEPGNLGMATVSEGGPVPVVRLDDYADTERVRVVKVDTEGFSADVLRSGLGLLAKHRPVVSAEANGAAESEDLASVLEPIGYRMVREFGANQVWVPV